MLRAEGWTSASLVGPAKCPQTTYHRPYSDCRTLGISLLNIKNMLKPAPTQHWFAERGGVSWSLRSGKADDSRNSASLVFSLINRIVARLATMKSDTKISFKRVDSELLFSVRPLHHRISVFRPIYPMPEVCTLYGGRLLLLNSYLQSTGKIEDFPPLLTPFWELVEFKKLQLHNQCSHAFQGGIAWVCFLVSGA